MYCRACTYDLSGAAGRCPECGRGFDPAVPRTYLRSLWWRRSRRWVFLAGAVALVYIVAPRGYVKGVSILTHPDGTPALRLTERRLAPPRWLWRVPYPFWTSTERLPRAAGSAAGATAPVCDTRLERARWFQTPRTIASMSVIAHELDENVVRKTLGAFVRQQCRGRSEPHAMDEDLPRIVFDEVEPW